jgi:hypothetical protein
MTFPMSSAADKNGDGKMDLVLQLDKAGACVLHVVPLRPAERHANNSMFRHLAQEGFLVKRELRD